MSWRGGLLATSVVIKVGFPPSTRLPQRSILRAYAAHAHRTKYAMAKVYLRNAAGSDELHISFHYTNPTLHIDRDFNFCRKMNEPVDDALARIRNNIEKELAKRAKKGKAKKTTPAQVPEPLPVEASEIIVQLLRSTTNEGEKHTPEDQEEITGITFAEALQPFPVGRLHLRLFDQRLAVVLNQPWVLNLVMPTTILSGFAVYPSKVEMQFADREHSQGAWFKAKMPLSGDLQKGATWLACGEGFLYRTSNEDIDHHLKFVLTPSNASGDVGPPVEGISKNVVQAGPGCCPFETRHCFTSARCASPAADGSARAFRVISYNLLADLYADSDYTRTHLFPYCPPYALKIDYRKQLFMQELLGYNADLMCLQEVDLKIFDSDLRPVLESPAGGNWRGHIAQKGTCGEGVATFYRSDRFECLRTYELNIGANIQTLPAFAGLWQRIAGNAPLVERICERSTTVQVTLLRLRDSKDGSDQQNADEASNLLLVANTHLYFHPDADHIRLLQCGFAMLYVRELYEQVSVELAGARIALIFCGDFNSVPECGIYRLMTQGHVDEHFVDWSSNQAEAVRGVSLRQPFKMLSACGTPTYTNYTHAFAACLDYIFYQSDCLAVEQVVPLPTDEELQAHTAIPSVVFPSDHVALVADLKFKAVGE